MISGGIVTMYVTDMDRALQFYTETLGLELVQRSGPSWTVVRAGEDLTLGLHEAMKGAPVGETGSATVGFRVEGSLPEVVAELESRGVVFTGDITEETAVPLAYFEDPDGNQLYLVEQRGAHA